jgi:hypothetical protein
MVCRFVVGPVQCSIAFLSTQESVCFKYLHFMSSALFNSALKCVMPSLSKNECVPDHTGTSVFIHSVSRDSVSNTTLEMYTVATFVVINL